VVAATAAADLKVDTFRREGAFSGLADQWDALVKASPRPSPFLLHGWLSEWWRHYGSGCELAVHVSFRGSKLVGALPLCVSEKRGLRVTSFIGGDPGLADVLLADGEGDATAGTLARRAAAAEQDLAEFSGLPTDSRLAAALGRPALTLIERAEAPVLDLSAGWDAVYAAKFSSKQRSHHRRRRRQLSELGPVAVEVARTAEELGDALENAFVLHDLRWQGRPDGSGFTTPVGRRFSHAVVEALAPLGIPRIVTLKIDGRAVAFHYYLAFEGRIYVHRIAFDPAFARFSPGVINTLDAIEAAAAEGATRVEFLGGAERYKVDLADRLEPLYQGFGLAGSFRGRAAVARRLAAIRTRKLLKRSHALRHFYFEGLAPARRILGRLV
jgi:CelD/BcsL family acetyltransferase involved in cellulose biosynthesis